MMLGSQRSIVCKQKKYLCGALWREPISPPFTGYNARGDTGSIPACCRFLFLFTPPHFLSKILHCPIQIKAKKTMNESLKKVSVPLSTGWHHSPFNRPIWLWENSHSPCTCQRTGLPDPGVDKPFNCFRVPNR